MQPARGEETNAPRSPARGRAAAAARPRCSLRSRSSAGARAGSCSSLPWWTSGSSSRSPALVLCVDLWLGTGGLGWRATGTAALVLLGLIVAGNVVGWRC